MSIYKPKREKTNTPVVPHRFAINIEQQNQTTKLRTDRYYIHVYQTKIGPERKTLRSKKMSKELNKILGTVYYPRERDLPREWQGNKEAERRRPIRVMEFQKAKDGWTRATHKSRTQTSTAKGTPQEENGTERGEKNTCQKTQQEGLTGKVQRLTEVLEKMLREGGQI